MQAVYGKPGAHRDETGQLWQISRLVLQGQEIPTITVNDVLAYQAKRSQESDVGHGTQLRPATINPELAALRAMLNYHIRQGMRLDNPVSKIKFQPEDNDNFHVLTKQDEVLYLAATTQPLHDIAVIMLQTAMRRGVHLETGTGEFGAGLVADSEREDEVRAPENLTDQGGQANPGDAEALHQFGIFVSARA